MYPGAYKNFDDLEDSLTQEELELMYESAHRSKEEDYRFLAAIQGLELGESEESKTEAAIRRAEAKALGLHEEEYNLDGLFQFIDEDEIT